MNLLINSEGILQNSNINLLNDFIKFVEVNPKTTKSYINNIKLFLKWLNDNEINKPNRDDIINYKKHLDNKNLTARTKNQYLRAVKQFFKWLELNNFYKNIAINIKSFKVDTSKSAKESFNENDIIKILSDIDTTTLNGKRDKAIILLMVVGGLRVSEVANIDMRDLQIIKNQMVVYIQGKGHIEKDTYIKIIEPVANLLNEYLRARGNVKPNQPLFTGNSNHYKNQRLTSDYISKICKKHFKKSGYNSSKLTAHSLRHTSNTLLFKSGADLFKVQNHARHKDPKTTEIYLHINERDNDNSEQEIYNQIYSIKNNKIDEIIKNLTDNEKQLLLNQLLK